MDLNAMYHAHQLSLIRAAGDDCCCDRSRHLADASLLAGRIAVFQRGVGANAASDWEDAR